MLEAEDIRGSSAEPTLSSVINVENDAGPAWPRKANPLENKKYKMGHHAKPKRTSATFKVRISTTNPSGISSAYRSATTDRSAQLLTVTFTFTAVCSTAWPT